MKKTSVAALALLAIACNKKKQTETPAAEAPAAKAVSHFAAASWLEGRWEHNTKEGNMSEIWTKANDSVYHGAAYFVIGKDTVFHESVELTQKSDGELYYIVTVPGQNGDKPVEFKRTSGTETEMAFENPQHDFPSRIEYRRVAEDSLVATISGKEKGKPKLEHFPMKRVR